LQATKNFLLARLWTAGKKPNYFHHGQFTTIREAILNHSGEALTSRRSFQALYPWGHGAAHRVLENPAVLRRERHR